MTLIPLIKDIYPVSSPAAGTYLAVEEEPRSATIVPGKWNYLTFKPRFGKAVIIGYVHNYRCWEYPKDKEGVSNNR